MKNLNVAEAKNTLTQLLQEVEAGERITICRHGKPVADLVPTRQTARTAPKLGAFAGKRVEVDPDWWKPMSDEEAEAFIDGKY
ncbi:MAG TPA: type II toxin-antitoxin system prevent-host-death family antitoxin [Bryobacteraceae bacterium]|jgi:prevent-host-death family protein|nr:type II toxin-antitoxin system prevent-host-death family antitoxin [Bryobacteraceae bacterium]